MQSAPRFEIHVATEKRRQPRSGIDASQRMLEESLRQVPASIDDIPARNEQRSDLPMKEGGDVLP